MTLPAVVVLAIFIVWGAVSTLTQVRRPLAQSFRRFDKLGLLPAWNFFAPKPITSDFEVRYRTWSASGGLGQWYALDLPRQRRLSDALLNPTRREKKAMFEACARVVKSYSLHHPNDDAVIISMSYLLILGRVSAATALSTIDGIQFGIWVTSASSHGPANARQVFRSALHTADRTPMEPAGRGSVA